MNESKSSDSENRKNSFYARFRIHIQACAFVDLIALFISAPMRRAAVYIVAIIALVIFRLLATNRVSQLLQCQFLVGIMFDFVGGPFY